MKSKNYRTLSFVQQPDGSLHVYAEDSSDGEYLIGSIEKGASEWWFDPQVDGQSTYVDYSASELIEIATKINELNGAK